MDKETAIRTCSIAEAKDRLGLLTRKAHNRHGARKIKTPEHVLEAVEDVIEEEIRNGGRVPTYLEIRRRAFERLKNGEAVLMVEPKKKPARWDPIRLTGETVAEAVAKIREERN